MSRGLACPECGEPEAIVVDVRQSAHCDYIRRRRECANGHRYSTEERVRASRPRLRNRLHGVRDRMADEVASAIDSFRPPPTTGQDT